jgi:hypothetical protein
VFHAASNCFIIIVVQHAYALLQAGCSAVQLASAAGHLNIVKILLQNGAKPEKQDSSVRKELQLNSFQLIELIHLRRASRLFFTITLSVRQDEEGDKKCISLTHSLLLD